MKKIFCLALVMVFILSGFSQAEEVYNYRLKWLFNASVAGDIYADEYSLFEQEGLKVVVKEGGPEKNAIKELELGHAHFGVASADQVIRAIEKGAKVVVLAQIFQVNPMQWIYRDNIPEIKSAADLKGKNIGVTFGGNDESILNTLLARGGLSKNDVKINSVRFDFTPFLTKKVDIWPVYRNSQGVILQGRLAKEGEKVRFMNPADLGVNFVANSVVTSAKMMEEHPDIVKKFMNALLKGWTEAIKPANEAAAIDAIAKRDKGNNRQIIKLQLDATRELVKAPVFGKIDAAAWQQTEAIMLDQKQINKPVHVERVLYKAD